MLVLILSGVALYIFQPTNKGMFGISFQVFKLKNKPLQKKKKLEYLEKAKKNLQDHKY